MGALRTDIKLVFYLLLAIGIIVFGALARPVRVVVRLMKGGE